jgi:hypothetical protein
VRLRFDDPRTCAGAFALLCTGALVLASPLLGHRTGLIVFGLAGLLVGAGALRRVLVRRRLRRAERREADCTWRMSSESDVRWNAQGRYRANGFEPPGMHRVIERLCKRLGTMPLDLLVTYERDRT